MTDRTDSIYKKKENTRANIATVISIISIIFAAASFYHSISNDSKLLELEKDKLNISQYDAVYKKNIEKKEDNLDDLSNNISDIETLYEKVNGKSLKELKAKLSADDLIKLENERLKIFNSIWIFLDNENPNYAELNNLINNYLDSIKNSIVEISYYTESTNEESKGPLLPNTGSLPDLEKAFHVYKKEEEIKIKNLKKEIIDGT